MIFYEVLVPRVLNGRGCIATYHSDQALVLGSVVSIPFGNVDKPGIVWKKVHKPAFVTKEVRRNLYTVSLPLRSLEVIQWMSNYYAIDQSLLAQLLLPRGSEKQRKKTLATKPRAHKAHTLRADQANIVAKILSSDKQTHLLSSDTGFGKTHVYAELINQELQSGRSVVVLLPEIELSGHIHKRLSKLLLPDFELLQYDSTLSEAEKHLVWEAVLNSEHPQIIIGPRSALFLPVHNLGLIVIDEAHDQSYKQDTSPRYHAVPVAAKLANLAGAKLILATATPTIEDFYVAHTTNMPIHRSAKPSLIAQNSVIVDIADRKSFSRHPYLSDQALYALSKAQARGSSSIVLLNRRGTASSEVCDDCGWIYVCPACETPPVYHHTQKKLLCHVCGASSQPLVSCPDCKSAEIRFKGAGTERIARDLGKLFGEEVVLRIDGDTKATAKSLNDRKNILVGTQLLAKGVDLDHVDTLVVVSADTALSFPDFRANEQTFQLLYQAIGRIGRRGQAPQLVIQTRYPSHPALTHSLARDYLSFYEHELADRKKAQFPPFTHMAKITIARKTDATAKKTALQVADELQGSKGLRIRGPLQAFQHKHSGTYRWNILLYAKRREALRSAVLPYAKKEYIDIDPVDAL